MSKWVAVAVAFLFVGLAGCSGGSGPGDSSSAASSSSPPTSMAPTNSTPAPKLPKYPHYPSDGASEKTTGTIPSFDAHQIPYTLYKPKVANATQKVPILLHSHGFGGTRVSIDDGFKDYIAAGFGVLSFDERGHGDSKGDSVVEFMNPDYEIKDISKVVDYLATLDWVLLDKPGDPRLGGIGLSYGGAMQIMGAIFDPRFDAIVPEITWNDIVDALAPSGAIKSAWVDAFYGAGNAQQTVKFDNSFHEGFAWATASNMFPAGQAPGVPDLATPLHASSPAAYPTKLTIPTLLVQGMPDTLFPLNHAVANLRLLEFNRAPSALATHLGGHIFNTASLAPGKLPQDVGLQPPPGGSPCGTALENGILWHERYLLDMNVSLPSRVCLALDDGTAVRGDSFPLPGTTQKSFSIVGPLPVPTPTPVAQGAAGPQIGIPLLTANADMTIAGIPLLAGSATTADADAIVYFSLQVPSRASQEQIIDAQAMPLRLTGPATGHTFAMELGGVGLKLKQGESLQLVVSTTSPIFAANAERAPGAMTLDNLSLVLPVLDHAIPS